VVLGVLCVPKKYRAIKDTKYCTKNTKKYLCFVYTYALALRSATAVVACANKQRRQSCTFCNPMAIGSIQLSTRRSYGTQIQPHVISYQQCVPPGRLIGKNPTTDQKRSVGALCDKQQFYSSFCTIKNFVG